MQNEEEKHTGNEEELDKILDLIMIEQICFHWVVEENFKSRKFDKK